jgi:Flp pilus assembly protein TadG
VFFVLVFGIVEMALIFRAWVSVQHAAELGSRFAVTGNAACSSGGVDRVSCIQSEAKIGTASLHNANTVTVTVKSWDYPSYTAVTNNSAGNSCDAVEVTVKYTYNVITPVISKLFPSVTLTGSQRFISEPFIRCQ